MTFIDEHTRLCWVYLLSKKFEVENVFKEFYKMVEHQFLTKISILYTNNGTKYFNEHLWNFLREKDIYHQSTYIDTPQQNGINERKKNIYLK